MNFLAEYRDGIRQYINFRPEGNTLQKVGLATLGAISVHCLRIDESEYQAMPRVDTVEASWCDSEELSEAELRTLLADYNQRAASEEVA